MNFPSIVRFFAQPAVIGLGGSVVLHGTAIGIIIYLLLALPHIWEINIRRGEAVVIQAQMATITATLTEAVEMEVSVEPTPVVPAPAVAIVDAPVRATTEAVPIAIPLAKNGEYEPSDEPPTNKPPETPQQVVADAKPMRNEPVKEAPPEHQEVAAKSPPRQIADQLVIAESNITVAAIAPAIAGALVDEQPRLLPFNREPYYPLDALYAQREGRVVLLVEIAANGKAMNISVATSSGTPSLDASAMEAVRDWRFVPAKSKGVAVVHEALVPVNFSIRRS